jgi:hypothetical protein
VRPLPLLVTPVHECIRRKEYQHSSRYFSSCCRYTASKVIHHVSVVLVVIRELKLASIHSFFKYTDVHLVGLNYVGVLQALFELYTQLLLKGRQWR